ncbi:putative receptor protein kinase ZmPK1 [Salvia hispanica]|uniref:putative receptor protein kinase ZmPK1 n=1 Tax=Salvia hispanica TaxID=49212 RepID=UPI0020096BBA|nr:putative receptor protein kinase ZmPK1 [Salvia hispanica]
MRGFIIIIPILLYLSTFTTAATNSRLVLNRGDSITVGKESEFLTSPDATFTLGFYNLGTNAHWLAIWFTNSADKTVVWTANRNRPVNRKGSKATLLRDGTLVLTDVDGAVAWQTNTTSFDVAAAHLLNTGNLVLRNQKGDILWQSFDSPMDTLLPSQPFTKNTRLTSILSKASFATGFFNLYFGSDNVLRLISDTPDTSTSYWPNPDFDIYKNGRTNYNSSRIAVLDDHGRFLSSDMLQFNASDVGPGVKRRLTMDHDGNLRIYSLNASTGLWSVTWRALSQPCDMMGVCGKNTICVYAPLLPKCTCPPGYIMEDDTNWNTGCKPAFNLTLLQSTRVTFLQIRYADFYGFDFSIPSPVTLETCTSMCLEDFRCIAFGYRLEGYGQCFLKSAMLNGYATPDFPGSIYIKLPNTLAPSKPNIFHASSLRCGSDEREELLGSSSMYDFSGRTVKWVYMYSFAAALGAIEVMFVLLGWWFLIRIHGIPASVQAGCNMISSQFRQYTYSELKKATKNFTEELGRGGSGTVYKGVLSDDRVVAVKKLGDVFQAQEEYFAEISTIGKINHMNLVRIWGFCSERRHRLLVYEYLDNLSLDRHVFGSSFLSWKQRYVVALGTAKGLAYLHHECLEWVIHCDVKPENILLDSDFQPKIADFGLAKLLQREGDGSEFTRIRGTKGYMAPEWALSLPITSKVDVFGYGVVVLEMVRGVRLCNWRDGDGDGGGALASFVRRWRGEVEGVVDGRLDGRFGRRQATALIQVGLACVEEDRNKRPTMATVVQSLMACEYEED